MSVGGSRHSCLIWVMLFSMSCLMVGGSLDTASLSISLSSCICWMSMLRLMLVVWVLLGYILSARALARSDSILSANLWLDGFIGSPV